MEKRHFEPYYHAYLERIYKFVLYRVAGNRWVAEDLTQEIFLKAFEAFERFDPSQGQVAWFYTIARNHVINHYAKQRPNVSLEEIENVRAFAQEGAEKFSLTFDEQRLAKAMQDLSDDDARLVQMKYLEGWSFEDLGQITGKTSGALRVQAGRALKKLKQQLKKGI